MGSWGYPRLRPSLFTFSGSENGQPSFPLPPFCHCDVSRPAANVVWSTPPVPCQAGTDGAKGANGSFSNAAASHNRGNFHFHPFQSSFSKTSHLEQWVCIHSCVLFGSLGGKIDGDSWYLPGRLIIYQDLGSPRTPQAVKSLGRGAPFDIHSSGSKHGFVGFLCVLQL